MTVSELKLRIKDANLAGAYIFCGEEDYLKKYYVREMAKLISPDEAFAPFNVITFDGDDVSIDDIAEAMKSPPMMADLKLVEWKYPELDSMAESSRKAIEALAESLSEYPYTVLVLVTDQDGFDPGTAKRPSKLAARLAKSFNVINFEKSTDAQLVGWLKRHFDTEGIETDPATLSALIFRSGHSMEILLGEVKKLAAYCHANKIGKLDKSTVFSVASSTLECDAFALSTAITDKNRDAAFIALADMAQRRMDANAVLAMLSRTFSELCTVALLLEEGKDAKDMEAILRWNPYKIKISIASAKKWGKERLSDALARIRKLDSESKSGGISGYKTVEMFVCRYL